MDAPQIQYTRTEDGVSIAYWKLGEGPPLVLATHFLPAIELEWETREWRSLFEKLAKSWTVVRYDTRGFSLSSLPAATAEDYSVEARVKDLEAIVAVAGSTPLPIVGDVHGGYVAIAYAAQHPEAVSQLILWETFARGEDFYNTPRIGVIKDISRVDESLWLDTLARLVAGVSDRDAAPDLVHLMSAAREGGNWDAFLEATAKVDVTAALERVEAPTLVLRRRDSHFGNAQIARGLASGIRDARMTVLDGDASWLPAGDQDALLRVVTGFLRPSPSADAQAEELSGFRTVLFTDVEESTMLTDVLGDERARAVMRTHEQITRDALAAHQGAEVKTMGDGFMASFATASAALDCAIDLQRRFAVHNETAETPIRVRAGLNAGEPISEHGDLFGASVIVAARVCAKAEGGEILVPEVVRQLVHGKDYLFADRGETALKGFEEPVRLFEVRWQDTD